MFGSYAKQDAKGADDVDRHALLRRQPR